MGHAPETYLEREESRFVRGTITLAQLEQRAEVLLRAGAADRVPLPSPPPASRRTVPAAAA